MGDFLERGQAGGGLGTPVLRTSVAPFSPRAALLLFLGLLGQLLGTTRVFFQRSRNVRVREKHANARKISHQMPFLGRGDRMAEKISREKEKEKVGERGGEAGTEKAIKTSAMERSFGVKIIPAAIRSRGEVGIAAGELRSVLFAQTSSLS